MALPILLPRSGNNSARDDDDERANVNFCVQRGGGEKFAWKEREKFQHWVQKGNNAHKSSLLPFLLSLSGSSVQQGKGATHTAPAMQGEGRGNEQKIDFKNSHI